MHTIELVTLPLWWFSLSLETFYWTPPDLPAAFPRLAVVFVAAAAVLAPSVAVVARDGRRWCTPSACLPTRSVPRPSEGRTALTRAVFPDGKHDRISSLYTVQWGWGFSPAWRGWDGASLLSPDPPVPTTATSRQPSVLPKIVLFLVSWET